MTAEQVATLLLALGCVIALARLFGAAAKRIGQPPVIGEIVAGIAVGPSLFGAGLGDALFPTDIRPALAALANVGLVLFMFIVGYEIDPATLRGRGRAAVSVALGSTLLPLGLGVALAFWLAGRHDVRNVAAFVLFLGAAMAVTAMPVLARILADRGMVRTTVGAMALAAGAVGDIVAWSLLAFVVAMASASGVVPWHLVLIVPYLVVMFLLVRPALRRLAKEKLTPDVLALVLVGLLLSCWCAEWLGVHAIFGAFLFGAVMPRDRPALRHEILGRLEQVSVLLLLPCFFVIAGLRVDLSALGGGGLVELAAILLVAITGKVAGAYAGARLHGMDRRRSGALATLMNTRGLTELVILTVGLQLGILDTRMFSMMVVMALVTTAMAGPVLAVIYPAGQVEADRMAAERDALGAPTAFRVLVEVPPGEHAASVVREATRLARERAPAAVVVLNRLVPYPSPPEVSTGLTGELLAMTAALTELAELAAPIRDAGLTAHVTAHFTTDPIGDLAHQISAAAPDLVVTAGSRTDWPKGVRHVTVKAIEARDGEAVKASGDDTMKR
ncbi:sodium:proton antiporter [Virgisporangium aliadipatigenens]|uniref:Sodium:proton antiporter n=1 Tax=Virgisporangium aliadipatigenens TaxID=741659 RepID=A0A8J4DX98_9ACTN|nr:cation:proton antiporter [Virgisporangium aliadipatigenens]GIJ51882.1 sodium:proton antiporter [Virgisporangium aliadipatigenens]